METAKTLLIIRSLADGLDPETGKAFDLTHPYQHPNTIRALFAALHALEQGEAKERAQAREQEQFREQERFKEREHVREQGEETLVFRPVVPPNAGKPWTEEEDQRLCSNLGTEISLGQLAEVHGRTYGDIRARLESLGQLEKLDQVPPPFPESAEQRTPSEPDVPNGMYVFRKMAVSRESAASTP